MDSQKADIILVNPPYILARRQDYLPTVMPHISLGFLGTYLHSKGVRTKVIEGNLIPCSLLDLAKLIVSYSPRLIGISVPTIAADCAARLCSEIKKLDRHIPVIGGGPHMSAIPEKTLRKYPCFDAGITGEGELPLRELYQELMNGGKIENIQGLSYIRDGKYISVEPRPYEKDLDIYPFPDYDLYYPSYPEHYRAIPPFHPATPVSTMITSRGCPSRCTFCDTTVNGNAIRYHSVDAVISHMKNLNAKYGVRNFIFYDDTFMCSKSRVTEICEKMKTELDSIKWSCMGRISDADEELLKLMKSAGCYMVAYGIESGTQDILDIMKKSTTLDNIMNTVHMTKQTGIQTRGFFILGFPGETLNHIRQTIEFAVQLSLDFAHFTFFTPLPGSEISRNITRYGHVVADWNKMNFVNLAFIPHNVDATQLRKLRKQAYRKFYLRPRIFFHILKNGLTEKGYLMYSYQNVLRVLKSAF